MIDNIELIAQSALRIKNDNKVIYFDPYKIEGYHNDADYIFITHSHYDHFSPEDILKIKKDDTKIVVTSDLVDKVSDFNEVLMVEPCNEYKIDDILFETIPAYNIDKQFHKKEYNWVGYIITINNERIYVAGDTDNIPEARNITCDIACVPVGGTYTMDCNEASSLINEIKPKYAIPIHYKTVVGSTKDAIKFSELVDNVDVRIIMK